MSPTELLPLVSAGAALRLSLIAALCSTVLGLPLAVALGYALARLSFRGQALVSAAVMAPLVLPPVVTGLLLLRLFGRSSWLGRALAAAGLPIPFSLAGVVVAALVVGLPLFVAAARSAFESVDARYEEVSWTLGVPRLRTFWLVTLPLALPGLAAGAVLSFARALGEFGATVVLAGNMEGQTRTIALAVYTLLELPGGEPALGALVGCSLLLSLAAIVGYEALARWQRRRLELDRAH